MVAIIGILPRSLARSRFEPVGLCCFVLNVTLLTSAFYPVYATSGVYTLLWMSAYGLTFAWALVAPNEGATLSDPQIPIAIIFACIGLSILWSFQPATSLGYAAMLALNAGFAITLARKWPVQRARTMTRILMTVFVIACWVYLASKKGYQVQGDDPAPELAFQGIFSHKSLAGYSFAYAFLLQLLEWRSRSKGRLLHLALCVLPLVCLAASHSRTGLAIAAVGGLVVVVQPSLSARAFRACYIAVVVAGFLLLILPPLFANTIMQTDSEYLQLTGRTSLWKTALAIIGADFPIGSGYFGFFGTADQAPSWHLWRLSAYYRAPHLHNSFVEMLVELGALAIPAFAAVLFGLLGSASKISAHGTADRGFLLITTMIFLFTSGDDYIIFNHNTWGSFAMFYLLALAAQPAPVLLRGFLLPRVIPVLPLGSGTRSGEVARWNT